MYTFVCLNVSVYMCNCACLLRVCVRVCVCVVFPFVLLSVLLWLFQLVICWCDNFKTERKFTRSVKEFELFSDTEEHVLKLALSTMAGWLAAWLVG